MSHVMEYSPIIVIPPDLIDTGFSPCYNHLDETNVTSRGFHVNTAGNGLYKREETVLSADREENEMKRRNGIRLSNEESNRLTREAIESALLLLMEKKNFETISITDIIRRAGVSRSAYYRNYTSKEDILLNVFNEAAKTIVSAMAESITRRNASDCYQILFEKVWASRGLFEIIKEAGMIYRFQGAVNRRYLSLLPQDAIHEHYRILSWVGSVFNMIFGWIDRGYRESPVEMALICSPLLNDDAWRIGSSIQWEDV